MIPDNGRVEQLYPPIEPYATGRMEADSTHSLYYEESGNPEGKAVLFLHGGPGSSTRVQHRRYFNPSAFRIVLFDQRGCGQSTPLGEVRNNTTAHLVNDIECLRRRLGVEQWLLFGGSWGPTLALADAMAYPRRVAGLILRGIFLGSRRELEWYLRGLRAFVPEHVAGLEAEMSGDLIGRYHAEVNHPQRAAALAAARRWMQYEDRLMSIGTSAPAAPPNADDDAVLARTRVQLHYLAAGCFLREGELLDNAWRIQSPAILVQGRLDMVCPPVTAYELSRRLPACELRMVELGRHSGTEPEMASALRRAADDMLERTISS